MKILQEPGYAEFKRILKNKYSAHAYIIDMYFDSLLSD